MIYSHGINIIPESWEGSSLPMLFFIRAYGQTFKVCHHQLFLEKTFNIVSAHLFFHVSKPVTQQINICQDEIYLTLLILQTQESFQ